MSVRVLPERLYQGGKIQGEHRQWHPVGGVHRDWMTRTQHEARWAPAFISLLPNCGFCAVIGLMLPTLPCTGDPYPVGSDHEPQQALPPWSCSLSKFLVTVMGKITVLKWASSKVTGFSTAQITDQKSHLSWVNTQKATAAICGDDGGGEKKLHWIEKKARQSCFEEEADTLRWATWNKIDIGLRDESSFATQWLKTFPGYRICQALGHRNVLYQRTMTLSREVRKEQERVTGKKTQPGNAAHTVRSTIG